MNKKPKPGTAQNVTKATRTRIQGARGATQQNTQKRKKQREGQEESVLKHCTQKNQDEIRLRTLRYYGEEHRWKVQQVQVGPMKTSNDEQEANINARREGRHVEKQIENKKGNNTLDTKPNK